MNSISSTCSGYGNEEYRPNNLCDTSNEKEEEETASNNIDEDPDAMDETVSMEIIETSLLHPHCNEISVSCISIIGITNKTFV